MAARSLPAAEPVRTQEAYAAVFVAHRDAVARFAYVLCGSADVAEEILAEAFARVWPHWRAGRVTDERVYLRRAVLNEVRSRWRRRSTERRAGERRRRDGVDTAAGADAGHSERDDVLRAMASLSASQRTVVALRFLEDLSEAETAEVLGMRPGTVKSTTSRALARMRAVLEGGS